MMQTFEQLFELSNPEFEIVDDTIYLKANHNFGMSIKTAFQLMMLHNMNIDMVLREIKDANKRLDAFKDSESLLKFAEERNDV